MDRKQFLRLAGLAGCGGALAGCEGLDALAKKPEGAGIQLVSGVVFLAKYQSTSRQQAEARQRAANVVVRQGLNPAYKSKVAAIEKTRTREIARASSSAEKKEITEAAETQKELAAISVSAQVRKMTGNEFHPALSIPGRLPDVPPDPKMDREVKQLVQNYMSDRYLAVPVSIAGMKVERDNPSSVTVMNFDTRSLDLASDYAYVFNTAPRPGEKVSLDGSRAVYKN